MGNMMWITCNASNRSELLGQFSNHALLPSEVLGGWTYKTKPDIESGDLPFTIPDDPKLDLIEFISPALFPAIPAGNPTI
jgi:hypothetical protein